MRSLLGRLACAVFACTVGGSALAHHSVVTFDLTKTVEFDGVVKDWSETNPHAYLTLAVATPQGSADWRCESYAVASLTRLGVTADTFKPGERVHVSGAPSRVNSTACLLEEVRFADGRSVAMRSGQAADAAPQVAATLNTSIYGTWTPLANPVARLPSAQRGTTRPLAMTVAALESLTPAGRKATDAYDPIQDDPIYRCSPITPTRLWHEPDTDLSIRRDGDRILIHHEFMDAERVIHLNAARPAQVPKTVLGYSVGHFEGDVLVIQTTDFSPGLVMQYALNAQGKLSGVLHSDAYTLTERIRFDPAGHQLEVQYSHGDPKFYTVELPSGSVRYSTSVNPALGTFNCQITRPPVPN